MVNMIRQSLNSGWKFQEKSKYDWFSAKVPLFNPSKQSLTEASDFLDNSLLPSLPAYTLTDRKYDMNIKIRILFIV